MALPRIVVASADELFLKKARAVLGKTYAVAVVTGAVEAIRALTAEKGVRVLIAERQLSNADGITLLAKARKDFPKSIRILVTDEENCTLAEAVNKAHVYRLLPKSCGPSELLKAVDDAVSMYDKLGADTDAMRETLFGTVRMLVDILELTHPAAVGQSKRIRRRVQKISREMNAMPAQLMDMVVLLSNIGCVGLPAGLLEKMETRAAVTPDERKRYATHPSIAFHLLGKVPRMGKVAEIIRQQAAPCVKNPPLGSRILKVCIDLDQMESSGAPLDKCVEFMRGKPDIYDGKVMDALEKLLGERKTLSCVNIAAVDLEPGMVMHSDMVTEDGNILLHKGETLSEASHLRIQTFHDLLHIKEPICVAASS